MRGLHNGIAKRPVPPPEAEDPGPKIFAKVFLPPPIDGGARNGWFFCARILSDFVFAELQLGRICVRDDDAVITHARGGERDQNAGETRSSVGSRTPPISLHRPRARAVP